MRYILALSLLALPLAAQVKIEQQDGRISVEINGKPFTSLWTGADLRKPFLHPLISASGKIVTRRWPMETVEGEPKDHPHHRGLWFNHGDVNGIDFWGSDPAQKNDQKARIAVKKINQVKSGRKQGSITGVFEWLGKDGSPLLTENRVMTFHAEADIRTIDFDITLTANAPVKFGDTKEGSFGLRLAPSLQESKTGTMVNAEGLRKEKEVWGKPSPWVDYYGMLEGEKLGIAIFDHPSNPRHPTHWHSRAYGLFAANIFGMRDFYRDKSKDGSLQLEKGGTLRFRYRVIIHPGDEKEAKIAEAYKKYAARK
ncbi:MAG: PmoA family protein [Bryobacteraceae bacterium]|nr:PmoA family protein [Bryobacteraceae bacterium]